MKITIGCEKNEYIYVENNIQKKISGKSTGIGIKNIVDRYAYLSANKPQIIENTEYYKVLIPLIKSAL